MGSLVLAWPMRRLVGWGYATYVVVAMGIPLLVNKDFQPLGRYAVAAFPCAAVLALLWLERPALRNAWLAISILLFGWLASEYGRGVWVG
jgi:hypothetical protein